jgi:ABC-2 type transport system permease protein
VVCTVMIVVGGRVYYRTWITSLSLKRSDAPASATDSAHRTPFRFGAPSVFTSQVEVILKREYWQFFRDPAQWLHLIIMVLLVAVFLVSVGSLEFRMNDPRLKAIVYLSLLSFNIFLVASLALRFSFPMMSIEGKPYWTVRSAPLDLRTLYWIKWMIPLLPLFLIGILVSLLFSIPFRDVPSLATAAVVALSCSVLVLVSLNFGLGSLFSNFSEKNPIRIASSHGATLSFLFSMLYMLFVGISFFFPVYLILKALSNNSPIHASWMYSVYAANIVVAFFITAIAHWVGIRSLNRDF